MALNPSIILAGRAPDVMGSMAKGAQTAQFVNDSRYTNDYRNMLREYGAGAMQGDQAALGQVAAFDPQAALGIQNTRQQMDVRASQEQRAAQQFQMALDQMSKEEAAAETAALRSAIAKAAATQTPEQWDAYMMSIGQEDLVGQFDNREAVLLQYMDLTDYIETQKGLKDMRSNEPNVQDFGSGPVVWNEQAGQYVPAPISENVPPPPADPGDIDSLRKEFSSLPAVKDFSKQASAYGRIVASANDPSAAGDLALIFNYMKLLDPGSTVREGEFATAQNAGGVDARVISLYNSLINGERLSPGQRQDFVSRASGLYQNAEQGYTALEDQYKGLAERRGYPVSDSVIDFRYSGETPQPPQPGPMQGPPLPPADEDGWINLPNGARIREVK